MLQREAESNKQIYESLMQRTKETGISSELQDARTSASSIRRKCPSAPISPNLRRAFMLVVRRRADAVARPRVLLRLSRQPDQDAAGAEGAPRRAVPRHDSRGRPTRRLGNPLLTDVGVAADFSEAFKTVRTNVLFSSAEEGCASLVVTSAGPGEGKSIVLGQYRDRARAGRPARAAGGRRHAAAARPRDLRDRAKSPACRTS